MKKYFFLITLLLLITLISSCHHDRKKPYHKKHKKNLSRDTLFVTTRSGVAIWLDTITLEKRRKQSGDTDFYIGADDDVYYSSIADSILKAQKLPLVDTRQYGECKFIKFERNNGIATVIKIDTLSKIYTLYLFDPYKAPHEADITIMDDEYKKFYR